MKDSRAILERFRRAARGYGDVCAANPEIWQKPDVAEFKELKEFLRPCAEAGDVQCQYALAIIAWQGLCCESEEQHHAGYQDAVKEATRWWLAAAKQGYWPALDNLVTDGFGEEAKKAKEVFRELERERPDLVGWSGKMPVYGDEFIKELSKRLYGKVIVDVG